MKTTAGALRLATGSPVAGLRTAGTLAALCLSVLAARGGFVYETPGEFLTSGDFNGDGIPDVLVLDKATGNARVGYQDANTNLTWSAPLPTGVPSTAALAVGHFRDTNQDAVAVTSVEFNRISLVRLSDPTNPPVPALLAPQGVGLDFLAGLAAPFGTVSDFDSLVVGSSQNSTNLGLTLLELFGFVGDAVATYQDSAAQQAYLASGNSLQLGGDPVTYAAAMQRGSNDTFMVYSPSNHFAPLLSLTGLASGTEYAFGTFNSETLPRFLFYVPGQSNLTVESLVATNGGYLFDTGILVSVSEAIQFVCYNDGSGGAAFIEFGDGVQGLTLPGGTPTLGATYRSGAGAAGNVFTGVAPLGRGNFALLDAPAGSPTAAHAQVIHFDGSTYTQVSAGNLPALTSRTTRANVWLFQSEPFVTNNPGFISSLNAPDWSSGPTNSGGVLHVLEETDGGPALGLENPAGANLGALPAGASWAMADQYRDSISLFTYASPRAPEAVNITIAPTPGLYAGPIQVSFTTLGVSDKVLYRVGTNANYQQYLGTFTLTNDTTVQYYGSNTVSGLRSPFFAAAYAFGAAGALPTVQPLDLAPGSTNPAPVFQTNQVILSDAGTVFYGRRSSNNVGTVWAINLDGSGETYITTGARPRVSRDGQWLAFLREGNPFDNQGNLWVRSLASGQETRLLLASQAPYTNYLVCYDWDLSETNLILDFNDQFWRLGLDGSMTPFPLGANYNQGAPAVNPVDGRVAFQILYPGPNGIYLAPADLSSSQLLVANPTGPLWPAWSPDGGYLSLASGYVSPDVDGGKNLWVAELSPSNASVFQITGFTDNTNGFPHGAQWSPQQDALVGAGTIFGTNGIWVIPLNGDCMCSDGPLVRLPTSPGDPIDFVGSIVAAPVPQSVVEPSLFILLQPSAAVVYWSAAYVGFTLESTPDLTPPATWTPIPGPYAFDGTFYQYPEPLASLAAQKFFRLRYTGATQ